MGSSSFFLHACVTTTATLLTLLPTGPASTDPNNHKWKTIHLSRICADILTQPCTPLISSPRAADSAPMSCQGWEAIERAFETHRKMCTGLYRSCGSSNKASEHPRLVTNSRGSGTFLTGAKGHVNKLRVVLTPWRIGSSIVTHLIFLLWQQTHTHKHMCAIYT